MEVLFYKTNEIDESQLKYDVIVAKYMDKWIFCKNKTRKWELPGGHRELDECILNTAKRELFEETGAKDFSIIPVCAYSISDYGMLYYAKIKELGNLLDSEIEKIDFFDDIPEDLSFPMFHPKYFCEIKNFLLTK